MARRKTVAFFTNDTGQGADYQGTLKLGLEQACADADLDLLVYAGRSSWTRSAAQRQIYDLIDARRIDGIVLASGCIASYAPLDEVIAKIERLCPVPTCSVGQSSGVIPSILVDNIGGVTKVVDHLVRDHGRRQIAYIAGPRDHEESAQRLRGTRDALSRWGLELRAEATVSGDFSTSSGREAALLLLGRKVPFDGIIAASDDMALGALEVVQNGKHDAIAVAGFDDAPGAWMSEPPLTTVRQPMAEIGAMAIAHLAALWRGQQVPRELTIGTELVIRESCGCHPTDTSRWNSNSSDAGNSAARAPELAELLGPLVGRGEHCAHWLRELMHAAEAQNSGQKDNLLATLDAFVRRTSGTHVPIHELQRVITSLRASTLAGGSPNQMEEVFHAARARVGSHAYRRVAQELLRANSVLMELRSGWEQLATSLTLPGLQRALASELPRLGIQHALVALYHDPDGRRLVPLLYLEDGQALDLPQHPYPAGLLFPDGVFLAHKQRRTLTVLPLTFESQQLGVAVLELPHRLRIYELLREQIGSAIKTVQLLQQFIAEERRHAQAQEEKRATVERLRSVSLIAGGVAHDLNNVLGPLVALPETIQRELERTRIGQTAPAVREDLEMIRQAAQRAAHTIGDLLALGRGNEMPTTTLDLSRLVRDERRNLTAICESKGNIVLALRVLEKPLVVQASKPHMIRAITNLVLNAVDAIRGEGSIEVRVFEETAEQRRNELPFACDRCAVIEVEDDGAGIAEENLPRILEPFFSSKRHTGRVGTGLGLAIVNRIVQDSLGTMRVKSQLGRGSTFSIYLPLLDQSACSTSLPPAVVGGHERILVVDDEIVQLRTARRILEHLGYRVATAQSPEEALATFRHDTDFDLVIVDMIMPGGTNGIETVAQLRSLRPGQRALIASGYAPAKFDAQAAEQGLLWLTKPYSVAGLDSAVRAALEGCTEWPA